MVAFYARISKTDCRVAFVRGILSWIVENVLGDGIFASVMRMARVKGVGEYWSLAAQRDRFALEFQEKVRGYHYIYI
jgi:hypothetical protein